MISAARGQTSPVHEACTGPLLLVWPPVRVADQAFMILMAVFGVGFVAGDGPQQRLRVGGFAIGLLGLAAEVGIRVRTALHGLARMRRVIERGEFAGLERFEGGLLRFDAGGHAAFDLGELRAVEQDAGMLEARRFAGLPLGSAVSGKGTTA